MFIEHELVLLDIKGKANLFINTITEGELVYDPTYPGGNVHWVDVKHKVLYLTSTERIKNGDWYLNVDNELFQCGVSASEAVCENNGYRRIVATTNTEIFIRYDYRFADVLVGNKSLNRIFPDFSEDFMRKFVQEYNKGFIMKKVLVEYNSKRVYSDDLDMFGSNDIYLHVIKNKVSIKPMKDFFTREQITDLILRYNLSFGTEIYCRVDDNGTLLITKKDTLDWLQRELEKL